MKDGSGLLGLLPTGRFRIYSVTGKLPNRLPADWRLDVGGLADAPYTIGFDELLAMPAVDLTKDFQCVTGWRVPDVRWKGVRLADIIDRAAAAGGGGGARVRVVRRRLHRDPHAGAGPARRRDRRLRARREADLGRPRRARPPLRRTHVRLQVAEVAAADHAGDVPRPGYWEQQGYDADAWIGRSNGRSDEPV